MILTPRTVAAFWDELEKVGKEGTKTHRVVAGVLLDRDVPLVRAAPDTTRRVLQKAIQAVKKTTWSHKQIAIPVRDLDIKRLGFKPTKLAIPLPGESWGTTSWRAGSLHAHKRGSLYVMHDDKHAPSALGAVRHALEDVPEALWKRLRGAAREPVRLLRRRKVLRFKKGGRDVGRE